MQIKNTIHKYGSLSKALHWGMAGLFVYMFYLAIVMTDLPNSEEKWQMYGMHKQIGLLLGGLVIFRILWKLINVNVDKEVGTPKTQMIMASTMHFVLYAIMIGFPVSGYIMSMAGGHGIEFFGYTVPNLFTDVNKEISGIAHNIHGFLETATYVAVGLHVLAALHHHFIEKNNTLKKMMPFVK